MSGEQLIGLLTEIRDQQKRHVANFERAIAAQAQQMELRRKSRHVFTFLVFAPWAALVVILVRMVLPL